MEGRSYWREKAVENGLRVKRALADAHARPSGWWRLTCLFCVEKVGKQDESRSLAYNPDTTGFHCFRCGSKGYVNPEKQRREGDVAAPKPDPDALAACKQPPEYFQSLAAWTQQDRSYKPAWDYLQSRNMSQELVWDAAVGACPRGDYRLRIVVPVLGDDRESWLGWCARLWQAKCDKRWKYRFPGAMPRGELLYNHAALHEEMDEPLYIVEGVFDALAHWPHAVALFGDVSEHQIHAFKFSRRPLVVVLDGDAWMKGWALAMRLKFEGMTAGSVRLPPSYDPDEVPGDWLYEEARKSLG